METTVAEDIFSLGPALGCVGIVQRGDQRAVQFVDLTIQTRRFESTGQAFRDPLTDRVGMRRPIRRLAIVRNGVQPQFVRDRDRVQRAASEGSSRIRPAHAVSSLE